MTASDTLNDRSLSFGTRTNNRYWWHRMPRAQYVPPLYAQLDPDEWKLMDRWFADTEERYGHGTGECGVPLMSLMQGLITGSAIGGIVQCGHYIGYSTLLTAFSLRRMGLKHGLFSIDVDSEVTTYTQGWLEEAGLTDYVHLEVSDSADESLPERARAYLEREVELVFIDSSHQYAHTVRELDTWYEALTAGGLLLLHDVSRFAAGFDSTEAGGVIRGATEWSVARGRPMFMLNGFVSDQAGSPGYVPYADGCGLGMLQKPSPV